MSRRLPYFVVNAFAEKPFTGNGAAVCWVKDSPLSDNLMQSIATEINLSETCFIYDKDGHFKNQSNFGLRWFTPTNEVDLCGHATLASAATLFFKGGNENSTVSFETASGTLHAKQDGDYIVLDFPENAPDEFGTDACKDVLESVFAGNQHYIDQIDRVHLSKTAKKLVVQMNVSFTRTDLENLKPDIKEMTKHHDGSVYKGVIVTAAGSPGGNFDFLSRYFAPWNGIPEDPVTGSAHTVLAPYWSKIFNKREMAARQCSRRGGNLKVVLIGGKRVELHGKATVVVEGKLEVVE